MAILEIKKYPDAVLRKKAERVKELTPEIKKLVQDMTETMLRSEPEGIGLAAPQVGVSKMVIIARGEGKPEAFINPKILNKSLKKDAAEEGCLSLPNVWMKVKRSKAIEMEALNLQGKKIKIQAQGLFARVLQHETDHLHGILIIDKKSFWQKIKGLF